MMHFVAKQKNLPIPLTYKTDETIAWYVLIEPDRQIPEKRFAPWYEQVAKDGVRVRSMKVGDLVLETWMHSYEAQEKGFLEVTSVLDFMNLPYYPGIATHEEAMEQLEQ